MSVGVFKRQWPIPAPAISSICIFPSPLLVILCPQLVDYYVQVACLKAETLLKWLTTDLLVDILCHLCCLCGHWMRAAVHLWSMPVSAVTGKWVEALRATILVNKYSSKRQGVAGGGVQLALVTLYTAPYCSPSLFHSLSHLWKFVNRSDTLSRRGE